MKKKYLFTLIIVLLLTAVPLFADGDEQVTALSLPDLIMNIGRIAGIIGFFLLGITIFIGTSSRFFDKKYGMPHILNFHKKFALISFGVLIVHPVLLSTSNILYGSTFLEFYSSNFSYWPFTIGIFAFDIFLIAVITSLIQKIMNYALWFIIHVCTMAAFTFAGIHIIKLGVFTGFYGTIPVLNILLIIGAIAAIAGLILRITFLTTRRVVATPIIEVTRETHDTYTLKVEKPAGYTYRAGQFGFIRLHIQGMKKPHPFTLSSAPVEDHLSFTIKSIGKFTSNIRKLQPGQIVTIDGPYGAFTFKDRKAVFIAGGVGITPFRSILTDQYHRKGLPITLIYGSKTKEDCIFNDALRQMQETNDDLTVVTVLSREKKEGFENGHITEALLEKYTGFDADFYLCGPPVLVKKLKMILKRRGVSRRNIYFEPFFW